MLAVWATAASSAVTVAASAPAVRFRPELAFQLHEAPDPGAVGAEVRLDVGSHLADGGQVDAEQLRAPLQRRLLAAHHENCQRFGTSSSRSIRPCCGPDRRQPGRGCPP
jgi:hypothetical protein